MRRKSKLFCQVEHLELRQLLSTIYVDASAVTGANNGTSWAAAYSTLQVALGAATSGTTIDVATGDYFPGTAAGNTFQLKDGVTLQGGYATGGSASPDPRANVTVLDGETANYNVVTGSGTDSTAVLDGFTITGGNADGNGNDAYGGGVLDLSGSPTLIDCTISGNTSSSDGGGMFNSSSSPTLIDCTISGNSASGFGGGINNDNSSPTLINCIITGNTASGKGGGMYDFGSSPNLTNCTISGNTSGGTGGGIENDVYSSLTLTNSILWGDSATSSGNEIDNDSTSNVTATYSDIEGGGFAGMGNLSGDSTSNPEFIGSLRLRSDSPAIDAGNPSGLSGVDLDGLSRIVTVNGNSEVDMGAYQSHYALQSTIYVDGSAAGAGTGSDWADAYPSLAAALDYAVSGETIDVAQGTYNPTTGADRTATFRLVIGVSLQGGYDASTGQRSVSLYPTILSGDIDHSTGFLYDHVITGNSYHVVTANYTNPTAVLDGFTITGGNADGSETNAQSGAGILDIAGGPTITDCIISGNTAKGNGGGMYNQGSTASPSSPTLLDCTISGNAAQDGAGMENVGASVTLTDCTLSGNTSVHGGGGLYDKGSSAVTLIDCVISGNSAGTKGGAIRADGDSSATLTNCTLSGNSATSGGAIFGGSSTTLTNCILYGDTATAPGGGNELDSASGIAITYSDIDGGFTGTGNINADPMFISSTDLRLQIGSPAIGVGNASASGLSGVTTDLDGNPRIIGGKVDMGAYEARPIIYVNASVVGGTGDGTTWLNAYASLAVALTHATAGSGQSIDVAQGTYYPTTGTDGAATFQLENGVAIYGGYAVIGTLPIVIYNVAAYPTILSGNLGTANGNSYNSYHVVTASNTDSTAILDGFTITGGNASGANGSNSDGGGIYDNSGDPTINDCIITGNTAGWGGGGLYAIGDAPTLTNCTISGNTAGQSGGGIYIRYASMDATDCTITGNSSPGNGGGILLDSVSLALNDCTITGNSTPNSGGGLANIDSSLALINCVIVGNTAHNGAGMFNLGSSPKLINCTVTGNAAGNQGGAIVDDPTSSATLVNCILWGDTASNGNEMYNAAGSSVTISYSDIDQSGLTGAGNIDADPTFIRNPSPGADGVWGTADDDYGNLILQQGLSPAIDAGNNAAIQAVGITTDINGNPRIINGIVDMGAYEAPAIIFVDLSATGGKDGASWANAYTSLTTALTNATANSGVTIEVAAGDYSPGTTSASTFQLKDGVNLEGGYAPGGSPTADPASNVTTLDGGSVNSNVVTGSGTNSTALIEGFTITRGIGTGGGVYIKDGSPTLSDCIISGNTTTGAGGGVYIYGGSPTLNDCTISRNTSSIIGGGLADVVSSDPTLINCLIEDNSTSGIGAGIANTTKSKLTLIDCTITGNTATEGGGGLENFSASATLTGCAITGNTATSRVLSEGGGGIFNDYSSENLTNCVITGNTSGNVGGAIDDYLGASTALTNCTLTGNTASNNGGAIFNGYSAHPSQKSSVTITNSILWGDSASNGNEIYSEVAQTITYSDIDQSGYAGSNNNIDSDPQFIRPPGTNGSTDYGDLHLQFTSPAIDVGNNAAIQAVGITTDLDGNQRIFNFPGANDPAVATVDMGAYELGYNLDEIIVPAGQLRTLPAGGYPFSANLLSIGTGGTLDVADDTLTLNYGLGADPISSVAGWIDSGYADGAWTGTGITSSANFGEPANATGVGYFDNDSNQVTIRRTWIGDANLDGVINSDDLSLMMLGQAQGQTRWQDGNFNYDTQINADDWIKFMYVNAYSNGQMLPGAQNDTAIASSHTASISTAAFAQTPLASADDLSDLLSTPAAD